MKKLTVSILLHSYRFNAKLIPKEDHSMEVRSRRYGTRTMFDTAGNHQPDDYATTTTRAIRSSRSSSMSTTITTRRRL